MVCKKHMRADLFTFHSAHCVRIKSEYKHDFYTWDGSNQHLLLFRWLNLVLI